MTKIILQEDVEDLGEAGDVVDVKPGYARNYLFPQGFAVQATEGNLKQMREEERRKQEAADRVRQRAEDLAGDLAGHTITFNVRAAEEGKLFGSVTAADIAERLQEDGLNVEKDLVDLEEPIKELGVYNIPLELHSDVRPEVKVWVVAEE
ncbi:MAG: 50S ribosomal protein L9 [Candidatus Palauibacterales bacterium]|nr:50S ribosomal protein L9 [Candidatus Palauibacterales bacterium]